MTFATTLYVDLIACAGVTFAGFDLFDNIGFEEEEGVISGADILAEFSGRACYESYHRPNPATRKNEDYLANILKTGHESVLEHATATFYVAGVSRNLLLELERHRHLSFSVISTRYVDPGKMGVAIHPNTPEGLKNEILEHDRQQRRLAEQIFQTCIEQGMKIKQAREVARQVLPGNTETKFVVTGNMRAWRYVINLRNSPEADAEIRHFAQEVLALLKYVAPNTFQDMPADA